MKRSAVMLAIIALGWAFASAPVARAQSATPESSPNTVSIEKVIVTATRIAIPHAVIDNFIGSYTAPTRVAGKIARWKEAICPKTIGLTPELNASMTMRVKEVAAMAGTQVAAKDPCQTNILIVFTAKPQALLDEIQAKHPALLGYSEGPTQAKQMATVSHPIQAWYATQTEDLYGEMTSDDSKVCEHSKIDFGPKATPVGYCKYNVSGGLVSDGLRSEFTNVLIVADTDKVVGYEIGSLADYIAMLALSQTKAFDACEDLASIVNLMSSGCDASRKANALTESDIAYLRAIYKMNPDLRLNLQKDDIAYEMEKSLGDR